MLGLLRKKVTGEMIHSKPHINSRVRVVIDRSEIHRVSCVWTPNTLTIEGTVCPSNLWDEKKTFRLRADGHSIRFPVIPLSKIVSMEIIGIDNSTVLLEKTEDDDSQPQDQPLVYEIKSQRTGQIYQVTKERNRWRCSCVAGLHGKSCKHVKEAQALSGSS